MLLAGGSLLSPQLLQLSGVGPAELLREHGIAVVHELPGVGDNLQDHLGCRVIYKARNRNTLNEISRSWLRQARTGLEYVLGRRGALMMGAAPIGLFAKNPRGPGLARRAVPVPRRQLRQAGRADAPVPGLLWRPHPVPAGKPRLAAHQIARPERAAGDAAELPGDARRPGDDGRGAEDLRGVFQTPTMQRYVVEEFWPGPAVESDEHWLANTPSAPAARPSTRPAPA